jgi:hypothetical protein
VVVVAHLRRWRASSRSEPTDATAFVAKLEKILQDYVRAGDHRLVGLRDDAARLYLNALLEYVSGRLGVEPNRASE